MPECLHLPEQFQTKVCAFCLAVASASRKTAENQVLEASECHCVRMMTPLQRILEDNVFFGPLSDLGPAENDLTNNFWEFGNSGMPENEISRNNFGRNRSRKSEIYKASSSKKMT